jgi:hypothetical protein
MLAEVIDRRACKREESKETKMAQRKDIREEAERPILSTTAPPQPASMPARRRMIMKRERRAAWLSP